ncbi:MAG: dTDP-4-dehydrorhamnose 3,5-epimerase [Rhodocyclaceae bacterium]|nr:dTDP-4-dehydrorhamnose 3,5-epimerase [Rhodocyclaceae bacterium]
MFELRTSEIAGCFEIQPRILSDSRGRFVKVFHRDAFREFGLETDFDEEYYSVSRRGVVRGLHFQVPPKDHNKVVYCVQGEVFDVVLDLRIGSPTYGMVRSFELSADRANYIYIPSGLAHGFCVTSDVAVLVYKVSSVYSPEHDLGIRWDSVGVDWPVSVPMLSERDSGFMPFVNFESPFVYEER